MNKDEMVIERIIKAPVEDVWEAWTKSDFCKKWFGPLGFTAPVCNIDLKVGGEYTNMMKSPDGKEYWSKGVFKEIVTEEKLVMTDSFADEKGNIVPATHYGLGEGFPMEMTITVTFEGQDDMTRMILKVPGIKNIKDEDRYNMEQGWNQQFDKLTKLVEKKK